MFNSLRIFMESVEYLMIPIGVLSIFGLPIFEFIWREKVSWYYVLASIGYLGYNVFFLKNATRSLNFAIGVFIFALVLMIFHSFLRRCVNEFTLLKKTYIKILIEIGYFILYHATFWAIFFIFMLTTVDWD